MKKIYKLGRVKTFWLLFFLLLCFPHFLVCLISRNRRTIELDVKRWIDCTVKEHHGLWLDLSYLLTFFPEYRNVFYLRIGYFQYCLRYLPPLSTLYINTKSENFGAGTFIQHGFATVITAKKNGRNCWINQQVTIGYNKSLKYGYGMPDIGNNVRISAGAKVCGKITVGDDSTIGVNAVVVKDVPPASVVIPSPMFLIQENGERVYKKF